jgi:hypothetical protein
MSKPITKMTLTSQGSQSDRTLARADLDLSSMLAIATIRRPIVR